MGSLLKYTITECRSCSEFMVMDNITAPVCASCLDHILAGLCESCRSPSIADLIAPAIAELIVRRGRIHSQESAEVPDPNIKKDQENG